jgi:hypothetical protein
VGHVERMGERRVVCRVLVGNPKGKLPVGRLRRRWELNIKVNVQQMGCGAWTGLIWIRLGTGSRNL